MLAVHDAAAAIDFYKAAFGAKELGERYPWEGKIGHAELEISGAVVMLADEFPEFNKSPKTLGGTPVIMHIEVDNADEWLQRAEKAGATVLRPAKNESYGRVATIEDPFGHRWMLRQPNA